MKKHKHKVWLQIKDDNLSLLKVEFFLYYHFKNCKARDRQTELSRKMLRDVRVWYTACPFVCKNNCKPKHRQTGTDRPLKTETTHQENVGDGIQNDQDGFTLFGSQQVNKRHQHIAPHHVDHLLNITPTRVVGDCPHNLLLGFVVSLQTWNKTKAQTQTH